MTPPPSAKQIRDSFEQPTVWGARDTAAGAAVVPTLMCGRCGVSSRPTG